MRSFVLNRRTFLRGMGLGASAAVGLPVLEAMLNSNGTALAATGQPIPKRLGIMFFGNGVRLDRWIPAQTGPGWALTPALAPLQNVKDYISVVSGYRAKAGYGRRGHHDGCAAMLSGIPFIELPHADTSYSSKFGGPSIDQVAADRIAGDTLFPSLQLAVSKRVIGSEGPTLEFMSHRGPDAPLDPEFNPRALFERVFSSFTPPDSTDPTNALRVSVLDLVKADAKRIQKRLGRADQVRLDAHFTSIAQLEREISALPPVLTSQCTLPEDPNQDNRDVNGNEPIEAVSQAMAKLTAFAFACDLSRVVTVQLTGSVGYTVYNMLGQTRGHHDLSHDGGQRDAIHAATVWNVQQFAYWMERMKEIGEGEGNLLDNSAWMLTSDTAEGESHSSDDYPILIAGKGGDVLRHPGVHHRGTTADNTSDVLLTLLRAAGTGVSDVGADQGYSNRPCAAIEV